jgi:enamine deaminase RidA (YjgF/YER057c/UK114 family)
MGPTGMKIRSRGLLQVLGRRVIGQSAAAGDAPMAKPEPLGDTAPVGDLPMNQHTATPSQTDPKAPISIVPGNVPTPKMAYSPAVKAGDWVFVAGQLATDFKNGLAPEVVPQNKSVVSQLGLEADFIFKNLKTTFEAAGCDMDRDSVRIWQWYTSDYPTLEEFAAGNADPRLCVDAYQKAQKQYLSEPRPATSGVSIRQLAIGKAELEIDVICIADGKPSMGFGGSEDWPAPAIRHGDWVFISGLVAPSVGDAPGTWFDSAIEAQTERVLQKLAKLAESAGSSLGRAVKADVYLPNPADYAGMDAVWKRWFPNNPPARSVVPHVGLGAAGARVQIALTLLATGSSLSMETIETSEAPEPFSHEPQAVKVGNFLFLSQQMATTSKGELAPGMLRVPEYPWYGSPGTAQMRYMMQNVAAICEKAGTKLDYVVKRQCFHPDSQWFQESINEWAAHFPGVKPASTTLKIGGPLVVPGANTMLDLIAYVPD